MEVGDIVFLSASVPHRQAWTADAKPAEIEEAIVSLARAVFARKGRLLFGGHPSVSPLIASVAGEYFPPDTERKVKPVITFQSEFFKGKLPDETWELARMGWSSIHWTERKETQADSLTVMRAAMLSGVGVPEDMIQKEELKTARCMVAIGGMEGIRDEAAAFWQTCRRPVFVVKSGGGAAARLLDPPDQWERSLWPADPYIPKDAATLFDLRGQAQLIDLEESWWRNNPGMLPRELPFQPYPTIMQWLLDDPQF